MPWPARRPAICLTFFSPPPARENWSASTRTASADASLANIGSNLIISNFVKGGDGSIWFNQQGTQADGISFQANTHRIGRINATGTVTYTIPPNDDTIMKATTVASDGSLWTT